MPTLLRDQTIDVRVDFGGFGLQDTDYDALPLPYPDERVVDQAPFLSAFEGRVDVESAAHTHTATLTFEVWDSEPPEDRRAHWEVQGEAEILSPSGELEIRAIAGAQEDYLQLGGPGAMWKMRVYCTGREEVARLELEDGIPHGVEIYLAQFWMR
ncbi:hypothetical protein [Streptomyces syringium]|uniref:hypothetical protein n=1 Tax=Streptomyces syringium TaxID=76729 RepID=UPI003452A251